MSECLDAALRYAARGWPVFPCNGKRPMVANGFHDATTDREMVEWWWRQWPDANVAVPTGGPSGLLVLDVDPDKGGGDSLHELEREHGELPRTPSVTTPSGGQHFYFRHPGGEVPSNAGQLGPGLDIRADGGYVVAPPSRGYVPDEQAPLAGPPAWLLECLHRGRRNGSAPVVGDAIPEGKRNATLASVAGTMRRRGFGQAAITAALQVTNKESCKPPLPDSEVEGIAASVARYEPSEVPTGAKDPNGEPPESGKLRHLDIKAMVRENPPEVPWLVEGLVVKAALTILNGREGEGKSLLAMAVSAGAAGGHSVAGLDCERGSVVYVDAENGAYEIHRRVHALELPLEGVEVYEVNDFDLRDDLDELEVVVERHRPSLLVLDSFRSLWGGDENDSGQVSRCLDPLRRLAHRSGVAILLLHHSGKANSNYRGSSAIGASTVLGFTLAREQDDVQEDRRYIKTWKCRPAPEPPRRWLRLLAERGRVYVDAAEAPIDPDPKPEAPKRTELRPQVLALLMAEPHSKASLCFALGRSKGDGTVGRLLNSLHAEGLLNVEKGDPGKPDKWRVTEAGKAEVEGVSTHVPPRGSGDVDTPPPEEAQTRMDAEDSGVSTKGYPGGAPRCSCFRPGERLSDGRCGRCLGTYPEGWS